jgi:hypothetical protein
MTRTSDNTPFKDQDDARAVYKSQSNTLKEIRIVGLGGAHLQSLGGAFLPLAMRCIGWLVGNCWMIRNPLV